MAASPDAYAQFARRIKWGGLGCVVLVAGLYFVRLGMFDWDRWSLLSADWGTFGDFVGGVAGTVIAVLTLLAIARTLELQATELTETRTALQSQSTSAREQLDYEARRLRPFLKTEWHRRGSGYDLVWVIRNVGLGPCILDAIEIHVGKVSIGRHSASADPGAAQVWQTALKQVLAPEWAFVTNAELLTLHDFKRVLGPNEPQETYAISFSKGIALEAGFTKLERVPALLAIVHYRAIDGTASTSVDQLDTFGRNSDSSS